MTAKKTGDFEMTHQERIAYLESVVSSNLAGHYEEMAEKYNDKAVRGATVFWDTVKGRDNLPKKPFAITIVPGDRKINIKLISDKEHEKRYFKKPVPTKEFEGE